MTAQFPYLKALSESNDLTPVMYGEVNDRQRVDYDGRNRDEYFDTTDKRALVAKRQKQMNERRKKWSQKEPVATVTIKQIPTRVNTLLNENIDFPLLKYLTSLQQKITSNGDCKKSHIERHTIRRNK